VTETPCQAGPIVERTPDSAEQAERDFFAGYYAERRYHPVGWRLRLERDLAGLNAAAQGRRLGRVLSVGCGDGLFERMLAPNADRVLGIDLSPVAIAAAKDGQRTTGQANVEFECMTLADLAPRERFDTIVCLAFLHHVPPPVLEDLLARLFGHLEPGGLLYTQDPNVRALTRAVGRRVLGRRRYAAYHSPDERELDPMELARALRATGFAPVSIRYVDVTLIPLLFLAPRGPDVLFHACAALDRLWCATPLAPWASGFAAAARKPVVEHGD